MSTIKPFKILIADDHQLFIDGIKLIVRNAKNFNVVAEALNGTEAFKIIGEQDIDVLLTDINMPEMDGIELTRIVKDQYPNIKVLVLTMHNDLEIINEILQVEADGYILKNTGKKELIAALEKIVDNGTYYSNEVLVTLMQEGKRERIIHDNTKSLTEREVEILKLIVQEYSSVQIGEHLFISKNTVDTHRKNILQKTGIRTIVGLIKFAISNDIIDTTLPASEEE